MQFMLKCFVMELTENTCIILLELSITNPENLTGLHSLKIIKSTMGYFLFINNKLFHTPIYTELKLY